MTAIASGTPAQATSPPTPAGAAPSSVPDRAALLECQRIGHRRRLQDAKAKDPASPAQSIGLALSGGGIRSATFSLGVLQALAQRRQLKNVDYLSTVSGGGYTGCFAGSLFVPRELRNGADPASVPAARFDEAGKDAFATLAAPIVADRVHATDAGWSGTRALAWLRDNGRYLAPRGTGDLVYAIALQVRNWIAIQFVIGISMLLALFLFATIRAHMMVRFDWWRDVEAHFIPGGDALFYWSPGWFFVGAHFLLLVMPCGLAYWFAHAQIRRKTRLSLMPVVHEIVIVAGLVGAAYLYYGSWQEAVLRFRAAPFEQPLLAWVGAGYALVAGIAMVMFVAALAYEKLRFPDAGPVAPADLRTRLTKWLRFFFLLQVVGVFLAIVSSCGQTAYAYLNGSGLAAFVIVSTSTIGIASAAARQLIKFASGGKSGPLLSLSIGTIATTLAVFLLFLIGVMWSLATQSALWMGGPPPTVPWAEGGQRHWVRVAEVQSWTGFARDGPRIALNIPEPKPASTSATVPGNTVVPLPDLSGARPQIAPLWLCAFLGGIVFLWVTTGLFLGFLNMSTLHQFYSARVARAYLGATNPRRFGDKRTGRAGDPAPEPGKIDPVSDCVPGDSMPLATYYDPRSRAPLHLINVTLNQTHPAQGQLVQRDRKGAPLTVSPTHFIVNGQFLERSDADHTLAALGAAEAAAIGHPKWPAAKPPEFEELSLADWCAISGAAFSTGLGMRTSLGFALLAGLANVRLGYWWTPRTKRKWEIDPLTVHDYLRQELLADFDGLSGAEWFLTDGGHFENTAAYELIRRRVGVIVVSDNGCDPGYDFEDLGNLTRKVRTDFGAEMTEIDPFAFKAALDPGREFPVLKFGRMSDFTDPDRRKGRCALLFRVEHATAAPADREWSLVIVLKPNLVADPPADIEHYAASNPTFPQQTTLDQFFDEAQWESYRKLGELVARAALVPGALEVGGAWHRAAGAAATT